MTPADLDRIEACVASYPEANGVRDQWTELLRLARRGLRAETEVCGTCGHAGFERGKYRCHALAIGQDADGYCCEWSSKEVEA